MSKKLERMRANHAKDQERIEKIQARIQEREKAIREQERTEIIGIVETIGMTPEQLADHFADLLAQKNQPKRKKEVSANETDPA